MVSLGMAVGHRCTHVVVVIHILDIPEAEIRKKDTALVEFRFVVLCMVESLGTADPVVVEYMSHL